MEGTAPKKKRAKKKAEPDTAAESEERGDINPPEVEKAMVPPPANQVRVELVEGGEPTGQVRQYGYKTAMGLVRSGRARYVD